MSRRALPQSPQEYDSRYQSQLINELEDKRRSIGKERRTSRTERTRQYTGGINKC